MIQVLLVFIGGGIGSVFRHGVNLGVGRVFAGTFPLATFLINVAGSFAMGLVAAWLAFRTELGWSQHVRLLLTTGFLGGFTTFSTFSLDAAFLIERDEYMAAAAYVLLSVGLGLAGLFAGLWLVRAAG
ncbi:MAG TPA: fluoride efflux transporter CrcB [Bauldia sp.]|nr:fluoride efflux transporter CrcB [Bauldia sp.]